MDQNELTEQWFEEMKGICPSQLREELSRRTADGNPQSLMSFGGGGA